MTVRQKPRILIFLILLVVFLGCRVDDAAGEDFYRTFEVLSISETGLTLEDSDGNVIEVEKDPADYRVGYKVRYDSVRNRLRSYRWQDYTVMAVSDDSVTLLHKTGDTLTLAGNYIREYHVGDRVRYDSVGEKLQPDDESDWQQYTVVRSSRDGIVLRSPDGRETTIRLDNNFSERPRGLFFPRYKVGDQVRYNAAIGQLRKDKVRTYDWQEYEVRKVTAEKIILMNAENEELVLRNTYGTKYATGDRVKYDRLNELLKKVR